MKRYIRAYTSYSVKDLKIDIEVIYNVVSNDIAASTELDSMDLQILDKQIVNFPDATELDTNSDAYKNFIEFVNKVDELLELRGYDVLGESEYTKTDSESQYRGIVFNTVKDINNVHISGKIMNTLRLAGHKETRGSRRTRPAKLEKGANSPEAKALNRGEPLIVGEFQSIRIKCSVPDESKANISNKEFYSYLDAIKCIDQILDEWDEAYA